MEESLAVELSDESDIWKCRLLICNRTRKCTCKPEDLKRNSGQTNTASDGRNVELLNQSNHLIYQTWKEKVTLSCWWAIKHWRYSGLGLSSLEMEAADMYRFFILLLLMVWFKSLFNLLGLCWSETQVPVEQARKAHSSAFCTEGHWRM